MKDKAVARRIPHTEGDDLKLAVATIICTVFALSLGDAVIKLISSDFALWQVFVLRALLAAPVLIALMKVRTPGTSLLPGKVGWTALRSVMLTIMWIAYYISLPHVALSVAAAVYYTLPLFITLFAALFAGEKVGVRGWTGVALGFCGVLLILRPQADDFNAHALLPLLSAILYAGAMILTRTRCRSESPLVLSLSLNVSFVLTGLLASLLIITWAPSPELVEEHRFLLGEWTTMGTTQWLAMALLAGAVLVGSIGAAVAYQVGPSSTVATFDFFYLAFAAIWGLVFFSEIPDQVTTAGIALIAVAGIIAVRR